MVENSRQNFISEFYEITNILQKLLNGRFWSNRFYFQ